MQIPAGDIDLLTLGEALIDLISVEEAATLLDATCFQKHQGGSPANIAVNLAKLGGNAAFVGKTGRDAFGNFITSELRNAGVITDYLVVDAQAHTSVIFVSRTQGTPDFEAYRDADYRLRSQDLNPQVIRRAKVVHASTWPLSREPFRSTVELAFQMAREAGKIISLDPNYSHRLWPDRKDALETISRMLAYATITKPSLDDAQRLFGEGETPENYIARFHEMGPKVVVLTMGDKGILLSEGGHITRIAAQKLTVVDATGAGDAFWAGFIAALLDGHTLERCVLFAREIVSLKLSRVGPLPEHIERGNIYEKLGFGA